VDVTCSFLAMALDLDDAWWGMRRDVSELASAAWFGWIVLSLVFGLPVASLALLLVRRWLAVVPLVGSFGLFSVWFLYYATDWWSNPGQGAWMPVVSIVLLGWLVLAAVASSALRSSRRFSRE
jgi:hypothetical protein